MNENKKKNLIQSLERLTEGKNNFELHKEIFKSLIGISRERCVILFVIMMVMLKKIISIGFADNTIELFLNIVSYSNNFAIPVFTLIFTGYAIFQALSNTETLTALLSVEENEKSKFEEYNLSYLCNAMLYLSIIGINFIILVVFSGVSSTWHLSWFSNLKNNVIATILTGVYIMLNVHALLEVKSFVFNLYNCFAINAVANGLDRLKKK
jgi:hypothetical protein